MAAFGDGLQRTEDMFTVIHHALLAGVAHGGKFGDVGAGREGFVTRAAQHDATQCVVCRALAHHAREFLPHRNRQRIELVRVIDGHGRDNTVAADCNLPAHASPIRK